MNGAARPESPGSNTIKAQQINPAELDPDLQALSMAKELLGKLDAPSDITKEFAVRKALFESINHSESNPTGYDASLRIAVYSKYEKSSLNIQAKLFNSFMAFLMKPKMIIQGLPSGAKEDNEPGFFSRMMDRLRGRNPRPAQQGGGNA